MHAQTCGRNEVVRELENDQNVTLEAKLMFLDSGLFSSIFLRFSILQVTTCLLKGLFT